MFFFFILIPVPIPVQPPSAAVAPHYPMLTVVDFETRKPIEGAHVYERRSGEDRDLGYTDANGKLPLPMNGTDRLLILRNGYGAISAGGGVADRTVEMGRNDIN